MYILYVPGQYSIQQGIQQHHQDHQEQTEMIPLYRRGMQIVHLDPNTLDLIERKIFGTQTEGSRGEDGLKRQRIIQDMGLAIQKTINDTCIYN